MSESLMRYHNPTVVEHLASHYVLGTLSPRVRKRARSLISRVEPLALRIEEWQQSLVSLDTSTEPLPPSEACWQHISAALDANDDTLELERDANWLAQLNICWRNSKHQIAHALSIVFILVLGYLNLDSNTKEQASDPLSYVAVLTDDSNSALLVASTYGTSKKLVLNRVQEDQASSEFDLELWVVSKTDNQARSLGVISHGQSLQEKTLTQAQWRLIKDSESLMITKEDPGGSPIGEPSEEIVARGLCVRLREWGNNA